LSTYFFQIHSLLFCIPVGLHIPLFQIQIYICKANFIAFLAGARDFFLPYRFHTSSMAHPTSYAMGTGDSLLGGGEVAGLEDDSSPPSSPEVKNAWNHTSALPYIFTRLCFIKHRDNFLFKLRCRCDIMRHQICLCVLLNIHNIKEYLKQKL
jgi:hypothetical protein